MLGEGMYEVTTLAQATDIYLFGSLLKQVPIKEEVKKAVKEPDDFNFRDLFDNKGHFKK